ncbi:uncharacterized protein LOC133526009 [Cydia pomonella]|uniref:uncharacterized protein LOC133526009 n=1 Tax=Cydia pomonella TaxID=82600 RepID=UPI002ADE0536|nr:uncharacterized protein LOC133526009 [Cydia pomonella]
MFISTYKRMRRDVQSISCFVSSDESTNMKSFACVVLLAAAAMAAPGTQGQRVKRGYLSGWSSLGHHGYSLDYAPAVSYSLHEPLHSLSIAPARKIVSYDKIVHEPKLVTVKKIVSVPKLVTVPKIVSVSKIVEAPRISYSSIGSHGWW